MRHPACVDVTDGLGVPSAKAQKPRAYQHAAISHWRSPLVGKAESRGILSERLCGQQSGIVTEPTKDRDIGERLEILRAFRDSVMRWARGDTEDAMELRTEINQRLVAARNAVAEAGVYSTVAATPPPTFGGYVERNLDPFVNIFSELYDSPFPQEVVDQVDRAIGVYELLRQGSNLTVLVSKEAIDIEGAVERSLRPAFGRAQPESERDVQDVVEIILNSLAIRFTREQESASVGGKSFRPDFVVADLDLAIEVKFTRPGHGTSKIQEEIAADISGYRTRWTRLLIIVYDIAEIADPYAFRRENARHFGVSVVVVKH